LLGSRGRSGGYPGLRAGSQAPRRRRLILALWASLPCDYNRWGPWLARGGASDPASGPPVRGRSRGGEVSSGLLSPPFLAPRLRAEGRPGRRRRGRRWKGPSLAWVVGGGWRAVRERSRSWSPRRSPVPLTRGTPWVEVTGSERAEAPARPGEANDHPAAPVSAGTQGGGVRGAPAQGITALHRERAGER